MENGNSYYLGLDIGTDSVGYAAATEGYALKKFRGEPVWGVTTFEAALLAEERRMNRTARRRLDRKQQRVQLLSDIFAPEICKNDPNFFVRRKESALFAEDTQYGVKLFDGGISDRDYYRKYPTIHHLIVDLMNTDRPCDVRLVYLACAWLIANRGHFLSEASVDSIGDFSEPYRNFCDYFTQECQCSLPWNDSIPASAIQQIMQADAGVTKKKAMFSERVFNGKKPSKEAEEDFPFRRDVIVTLLSGGKAAAKELFNSDEYADMESFSLNMDEDRFEETVSKLGDDGELLRRMRGMYDCAALNITLKGCKSISKAKVAVYDQHTADLKWLKYFIRKYLRGSYSRVFRNAEPGNYVAYSYNVKNCPEPAKVKKASKEAFSEFLMKLVKNVQVEECDKAGYEDMLNRLEQCTFLPKQKDTDNRVIPQQLYRNELSEILNHASAYLPLLREKKDGITNAEKILSIFDFKIPYFVGPLNPKSNFSWLERKAGRILPWNFAEMVDLDTSEENFIRRMTNTCTYLPGEDVLPANSLLYCRFTVLNELNNLKINQRSIPVDVKQRIFEDLYCGSNKKVTLKSVAAYLQSRGCMGPGDVLSGMDEKANANLKSYHSFRRMMNSGVLTVEQAEIIINHAAYSEDKRRLGRWLKNQFPALTEEDCAYIQRLNLKGFGRLSRLFLTGIYGTRKDGTGEAWSIMDALWNTNENLMQLLSERYTFREQIDAFVLEYYSDSDHHKTLSDRLSDMYISNAVKRPIIRALDITSDVVKAMGCPPQKIFIEMARGGAQDQKGKRTLSRRQQILELYKKVKHEDVPMLLKELEAMGEMADNRLQSDKLFLYYMQLGKCMYTGQPIELTQLGTKTYDIDHIYPQSRIQDDSVLNNKVLVLSSANGAKGDRYPVDEPVRAKMTGYWSFLKNCGLITEEKYRRLTRSTGFTEDELHQFISRQLVETRQSTKAVAQLLKERYPDTEIVYVKAGMVSEFRQEFEMLKCRSVNDLHHAKDAYLNIVVGNVYHEKFTRRWFDVSQKYTLSVKALFTHPQMAAGKTVWRGGEDLALVRKVMCKNAVHLTRYAFCRKGGLFDQMPLKASDSLIPRKQGLSPEKYGGYNKPAASFYLLASYMIGKKKDVMFVPVELRFAEKVRNDPAFAAGYIADVISQINSGKTVTGVKILLDGRPVKINTVLSLDGMLVTLRGKSSGGTKIIISTHMPLLLGSDWERYIKRLDSFTEKKKKNPKIQLDSAVDSITPEQNIALYRLLADKLNNSVFRLCPGSIGAIVGSGAEKFAALSVEEQIPLLITIVSWFNNAQTCDLVKIGGLAKNGAKVPNAKLSALAKSYRDIRILDMSASGLYVSRSENLLQYL